MDINHSSFQMQYNKICSYFRTTTEPFDFLEWDGKVLEVWDENKVVEAYKYNDLRNFITNL